MVLLFDSIVVIVHGFHKLLVWQDMLLLESNLPGLENVNGHQGLQEKPWEFGTQGSFHCIDKYIH